MIQHGIDVFLVRGDQSRVGEKILRVRLAMPRQILADAAALAGGAVADQSNNNFHAAAMRGQQSVVRRLKSGVVELALLRLDAQCATHGVAHGLRTHDARAHFRRRGEGVVDFEAARISRPHGIVRTVSFEPQPFDVRPAIAKGRAAQGQFRSGALHEGFSATDLCGGA